MTENQIIPPEENPAEILPPEVPVQQSYAASQPSRTGLVIGVVLIAAGLLFISGQFLEIRVGRFIWPLFILVPGVWLFSLAFSDRVSNGEPLAVFGSMTTTLGLLLLYQSITGHWVSWAYAWALIAPTSIGAGLWLYGARRSRADLVNSGKTVVTVGLIIFLFGAIFFEMLLGISRIGAILIPVILILLGVYLLFTNLFKK